MKYPLIILLTFLGLGAYGYYLWNNGDPYFYLFCVFVPIPIGIACFISLVMNERNAKKDNIQFEELLRQKQEAEERQKTERVERPQQINDRRPAHNYKIYVPREEEQQQVIVDEQKTSLGSTRYEQQGLSQQLETKKQKNLNDILERMIIFGLDSGHYELLPDIALAQKGKSRMFNKEWDIDFKMKLQKKDEKNGHEQEQAQQQITPIENKIKKEELEEEIQEEEPLM